MMRALRWPRRRFRARVLEAMAQLYRHGVREPTTRGVAAVLTRPPRCGSAAILWRRVERRLPRVERALVALERDGLVSSAPAWSPTVAHDPAIVWWKLTPDGHLASCTRARQRADDQVRAAQEVGENR